METYADEGWRTNFWHRCHILAQIKNDQNLDWYYRLLSLIQKTSPGEKEYKSDIAIAKLSSLDREAQKIILRTLQDVMIVILEPRRYLKELGVEIGGDYSYVVRLHETRFKISRSDRDMFNYYDDFLKDTISNLVLISSPVFAIGGSLSELPVAPRREDFFTPENILFLIKHTDSKKKVMGAIKLTSRLFVTFFEVIDPETRKRLLEEMIDYGPSWEASPFHRSLLVKALSIDRHFDEGDTQSVDIIKKCVGEVESSLRYYYDQESFPHPIIDEIKSETSPFIMAADWAAGFARELFEKDGISGVKQRFRYVIYNGEVMFG